MSTYKLHNIYYKLHNIYSHCIHTITQEFFELASRTYYGAPCPICCFEILRGDALFVIECSHVFHSDCIARWVRLYGVGCALDGQRWTIYSLLPKCEQYSSNEDCQKDEKAEEDEEMDEEPL